MEVGASELLALNDLLTGLQTVQDDDEEPTPHQITPYTLTTTRAKIPAITRPIGQIRQDDPKAIWSLDEVLSDDEDDEWETRGRPKFEILYKQNVMTEDVFLGLSDKDPSSAYCDAMLVRIECPEHRHDDIELDVKRQKLLVLSSTLYVFTAVKYDPPHSDIMPQTQYSRKLVLQLPYPVRHLEGHAKWDQKTHYLSVSLPIIRDEWE